MPNGATEQYQRSPVTRDRVRPGTIFSVIVFVLATILTPISVAGHWANSTILDTERYIDTVGPIGASPEVQDAFSKIVSEAIVTQVDTQSIVSDFLGGILPDNKVTERLAGPITTGINSLIGEAVDRFVASDVFITAWLDLNKAAQKGFVGLLKDEPSGPVELQGDNVVLNLDSVLKIAQEKLVAGGISFAANVTIPTTDKQFVLMSAPALNQARTFYSFSAPILSWIMVLIAAMFILAILLARRRARTTVAVGIAVIGSAIALYAATVLGEGAVNDQFAGSIFEGAAIVVYQTFLAYLFSGLQALVVLGVMVIIGGWLAGRTNSARYVRGHFNRGLGEIADRTGRNTGAKLAPYAPIIRWGVVSIWLLVLLSGTYLGSLSGVLFTLLMAGIWTGLEILIRARTTIEVIVVPQTLGTEVPDQV
jgi:hypothetical protein